jgi:hypothetical protein
MPSYRLSVAALNAFAQEYAVSVLKKPIHRLMKLSDRFYSVEVDVDNEQTRAENVQTLTMFVRYFMDSVLDAVHKVPASVRDILSIVAGAVEGRSVPTSSSGRSWQQSTGLGLGFSGTEFAASAFFHGFLVMAILRPVYEPKNSDVNLYRKRCLYVVKVLQKAALNQRFPSSDNFMTALNDLVQEYSEKMVRFVETVLNTSSKDDTLNTVDSSYPLSPKSALGSTVERMDDVWPMLGMVERDDFSADAKLVFQSFCAFYTYHDASFRQTMGSVISPMTAAYHRHEAWLHEHLFPAAIEADNDTHHDEFLSCAVESYTMLAHYLNMCKSESRLLQLLSSLSAASSGAITRADLARVLDQVGVVVIPMGQLVHARSNSGANTSSYSSSAFVSSPSTSSSSAAGADGMSGADTSDRQVLKDFARDSFTYAGETYVGANEEDIDRLCARLGVSLSELVPVGRTALGGDSYDVLLYLFGTSVHPSMTVMPESMNEKPIELFSSSDVDVDCNNRDENCTSRRKAKKKSIGAVARMRYRATILDNAAEDVSSQVWATIEVTVVRHVLREETFVLVDANDVDSWLNFGQRNQLKRILYDALSNPV